MPSPKFDACLPVTLGFEGVYSTVRADPGNWTGGKVGKGELKGTKKGIAASAYPDLDIARLTDAEIATIYERDYWRPIRGDSLAAGPDLATFDYAVNSGVSRASKALQKAVGAKVDGKIGAATIYAASDSKPKAVVNAICDSRLSFLRGLTSWKTFGKGWGRRVGEVKARALLMAGATAEAVLTSAADETRKAANDNKASKTSVAGGAVSGGGAVASQSGGLDWLALGGLAVAAVVLIGCGIILYRRAAARREMAAAMVAVVAK